MDLFHGHVFMNAQHKELGIIFHAKEYPTEQAVGNSPFKSTPTTSTPQPFSTSDASFQERNFMWLMSRNSLWMLGSDKDRATGFASLMGGPTEEKLKAWMRIKEIDKKGVDATDEESDEQLDLYGQIDSDTFQQMKTGTVESRFFGEELLDVNYFKTVPGQPLFFRGGQNAPGR
jgi:hypothetical protein